MLDKRESFATLRMVNNSSCQSDTKQKFFTVSVVVYNWGIKVSRGIIHETGDQDSAVGISISYWLVGLGFVPHSGGIFRTHLDRPRGTLSLFYIGYWAPFPGVKLLGHGDNHPPLSTAGIKYSCTSTAPLCLLHHRRNLDIT